MHLAALLRLPRGTLSSNYIAATLICTLPHHHRIHMFLDTWQTFKESSSMGSHCHVDTSTLHHFSQSGLAFRWSIHQLRGAYRSGTVPCTRSFSVHVNQLHPLIVGHVIRHCWSQRIFVIVVSSNHVYHPIWVGCTSKERPSMTWHILPALPLGRHKVVNIQSYTEAEAVHVSGSHPPITTKSILTLPLGKTSAADHFNKLTLWVGST